MTKRTYESESIRVYWDSSRCIHTGICLNALPAVFDVRARPWVDVGAADADVIASAVEQCPTAALRYERLDGGPQEQPGEGTTLVAWPNGPLAVRGAVEVLDPDGQRLDAGPRAALCRCGNSDNQPFCDLSHRTVGFGADGEEHPRPQRATAESPLDIAPDAGATNLTEENQ